MLVLDDLAIRAIANALWPRLKSAAWSTHRQTRDLSDLGARPDYVARAGKVSPHPSRLLDRLVFHEESYIMVLLHGNDWPGGVTYAVELRKDTCEDALRDGRLGSLASFQRAASSIKCRRPLQVARDRHGKTVLRRNLYDSNLTTEVVRSLQVIACAAEVRVVPPALLDEFYGHQGRSRRPD